MHDVLRHVGDIGTQSNSHSPPTPSTTQREHIHTDPVTQSNSHTHRDTHPLTYRHFRETHRDRDRYTYRHSLTHIILTHTHKDKSISYIYMSIVPKE